MKIGSKLIILGIVFLTFATIHANFVISNQSKVTCIGNNKFACEMLEAINNVSNNMYLLDIGMGFSCCMLIGKGLHMHIKGESRK